MPLKITDPNTEAAVLNRWADTIESQLRKLNTHVLNQAGSSNTTFTPSTGTGTGSIELIVPSIFTPVDQTVTLPGPLNITLADESAFTVFAGPGSNPNPGGTDQISSFYSLTGTPLFDTLIPSQYPEFAICGAANWAGGGVALDVSWSTTGLIFGGPETLGYKSVASGSCDVSITNPGGYGCSGIMTLFKRGASAPAVIQKNSTSSVSVPGTTTLAFTGPVTTGNMIFVQVTGVQSSSSGIPPIAGRGPYIVSDNVGNVYTELAALDKNQTFGSNEHEWSIAQWVCINAIGGSVTVSVDDLGGNATTTSLFGIAEFSNIQTIIGTNTPSFRALTDADLPVVDIAHGGTGVSVLTPHNVLLGEGTSIGFTPPVSSGYVLTDNGVGVDPTFQAVTTTYPKIVLTGATPTTSSSQVGLGTTTGIGNGIPTAVLAPLVGTGTGPTTATSVVKWIQIDIAGSKYWIPLMQ